MAASADPAGTYITSTGHLENVIPIYLFFGQSMSARLHFISMLSIVSFMASILKLKLSQTPGCYYVRGTEYLHTHLTKVLLFSAFWDLVENKILLQTALPFLHFVMTKTVGFQVIIMGDIENHTSTSFILSITQACSKQYQPLNFLSVET